MTENVIYKVQRVVTPNMRKIVNSSCTLMALYALCFVEISRAVFYLKSGHDFVAATAIYRVQSSVSPIYNQELWFLRSANHLISFDDALHWNEVS